MAPLGRMLAPPRPTEWPANRRAWPTCSQKAGEFAGDFGRKSNSRGCGPVLAFPGPGIPALLCLLSAIQEPPDEGGRRPRRGTGTTRCSTAHVRGAVGKRTEDQARPASEATKADRLSNGRYRIGMSGFGGKRTNNCDASRRRAGQRRDWPWLNRMKPKENADTGRKRGT